MNKAIGVGLVLVLMILGQTGPAAATLPEGSLPPELAPWQSWVLHGHEEALCPGAYNDGKALRCHWPSRLILDLSEAGGRFEQRWRAFADGWAALPGNAGAWPESVAVNGRPTAVIGRNGAPVVHLSPGEHRIEGRFFWQRMPETLAVPPASGLVALTVDGRPVATPLIDAQHRLWLRQEGETPTQPGQGTLQVRVFRLLDDTIPMQVTSVLRLEAAGADREVVLDGALIPGTLPMALESPLPVHLDDDGRLTVQVRAGRWEVRVQARMPGPQDRIDAGAAPFGEELWSFRARHDLRLVEIEGAPAVAPEQTEMPSDWRRFPAYLVAAGTELRLRQIHRGDPDPPPDQLSLQRTLWLDFDGDGFTVHDVISGSVHRRWHMAMNPPQTLGRVAVAGEDQVITAQGPDGKQGVQLRHGRLSMTADARLPWSGGILPAVGWDHDFQSVAGVLHLPPGWRLLAAGGVDKVTTTWLQNWSLLDLFLVLIIALAVLKLRGGWQGLLALAAMALIYHEPGAPRLVWLHLLAVLALLPLLPAGWFRRLVALWGIGATVVLLVTAVPFAVDQVRWGLYPQLAPRDSVVRPLAGTGARRVEETAVARTMMAQEALPAKMAEDRRADLSAAPPAEKAAPKPYDPDALIPTGPGLPDWQWQSVALEWRGPVAKDQRLRLYLLSPTVNLVLCLARVLLLAGLVGLLVDWRVARSWLAPRAAGSALMVLACLATAGLPGGTARAETTGYPPPELLEELRQRLLAPPDCLPHCADISRMELTAVGDDLQVLLKINAAARVAVPLPVAHRAWSPEQVLLNNAPIEGLARDDQGRLWALVPGGLNTLVLQGTTQGETVIQLPLPLRPRSAAYRVEGWRLEGIQPDGRVGATVQLSRLTDTPPPDSGRPAGGLPPFVQVTRQLRLGLTWEATTTITRLTPIGTPIVLAVPLIPGEAVVTEGIAVEEGQALIHMGPEQRALSYAGALEMGDTIALSAPRGVPWSETWVLDAAAVWECTFEGIAAVHHQDDGGQWQPRWQPWPGESVTIKVRRPPALPGQTRTIDSVRMVLSPGQRFSRGTLDLALRTHRGGQHTLTLPPDANLQQVMINGQTLPVRQEGDQVTVPVQPDSRGVGVTWHALAPFATLFRAPAVDAGQAAVNARITIEVPQNRWILLTGGPRWGPAVLFWSYLVVILLLAGVLGRVAPTPLRWWQWALLGLGLTQVPVFMALIIAGWLVVLGMRQRHAMPAHWLPFNAAQALLVLWTVAALAALFAAVKAGLLGDPAMQIVGNGSSATALHWTRDHIDGPLPRPWVVSLPVWAYRLLMLAWSLWLALALLRWLKWGWQCINQDGLWRKVTLRRVGKEQPLAPGGDR